MSVLRLAPFLIFIAFPLIELVLLIKAGEILGFWPTIAILFGSAALGVLVVRRQGVSMVGSMVSAVNEGRLPIQPLVEGYARIVAGMLLIVPGLLSDALALVLLVPPLRRLILRRTFSGFVNRAGSARRQSDSPKVARPTVIEGTYERLDEHDVDKDERR